MSLHDDYSELGEASKIFFLDTNLSSPVLITEIQDTKTLLDAVCLESTNPSEFFSTSSYFLQTKVSFLKKLCRHKKWTIRKLKSACMLEPSTYPEIEAGFTTYSTDRGKWFYQEARQVAQLLEAALMESLQARGLPSEEVIGTSARLGDVPVLHYQRAYEDLSNLYGRAESRVKTAPDTWTHGAVGCVNIWLNAHNGLLQLGDRFFYSSPNQLLMLKDKLATRYMMLEHVNPLGLDPRLTDHLTKLFAWQDETLCRYGNYAYDLLKAVEPMFKTRLSHIVDNVFGSDTAYTRMIEKMMIKERTVRTLSLSYGYDQIQRLVQIVEEVESVRGVVEMFGCLKTSGHPLIDPEYGGLSAAEAARSPDATSLVDTQRLRNTFCHIVLTAYIAKHGVWPKLFHANPHTSLKRLNDRQARNISYSSYALADWNTTEWSKILDFDYFPNFLELMDDKSISLYKSDKHLTWDRTRKPKSNRRLLLEVLASDSIDIEGIVKRVSRREVPDDWKIVSIYPKEREFKRDPRMFAMLCLEMRCFFTAIEANIAGGLFRYMPQQTMTKTKTQNQERLLALTDPGKNKHDYCLFLEIDLTRWNLKWRQLAVHALGHDVNMMFGTPGTFTVTHWFFGQAQIIVRVAGLRPNGIELDTPPESNLAWRNHLGGFEGLNQKLWTAATYAMVEMALAPLVEDRTISSYEVIGQGDNQVVRVSVPPSGRPREGILPEVRDKLNATLEATCASVNQEVKPEENIESTAVLTYSKDVMVQGVEYPTSLKKHSRLFPVTSLDFPSVTANARAILAGAVAGGENALYPLRSLIIGVYHAFRYLRASLSGFGIHGNKTPSFTTEELLSALIIPSSIGGLCGPSVPSFFYKGGSDPLGKEISGLRFLAEAQTTIGRIASRSLRAVEEKYGMSEKPDLDVLIDNPYGLPLNANLSPLSKVGELTLNAFKGKVKNTDIKGLLNRTVTSAETALRNDILAIRPLNPVLAHDLFSSSGFGTIQTMRKMFVHTRTVQAVAQQNNPEITHVFLRADINELKTYKEWYRGLPTRGYSGADSYAIVKRAREYWGIDLHGVTNYQPLDFIHHCGKLQVKNSIYWSAHADTNLLDSRGPLTGYIGTATREKRSEHGYKIVDTGRPSRAVAKLQLIRSQAYGNPAFNELIDRISLTRTPVRLSLITDVLEKVLGGSISHRYTSAIRSMGASYVGPLNFATHIRIDTDSIDQVSGSALNFAIMLQEFIIMTQAGAKMNYLHKRAQFGGLLMNFQDLVPLPEDSMSCLPPTFTPSTLPKSKLLYSPTLHLQRTYDTAAGAVPRGVIVPTSEYPTTKSLLNAAVGFYMATLRDQNRAKVIADNRGLVSISAKHQLDIAEAHALGPTKLIQSIAQAIVLTTIRDTFRTIHLTPDRWDESMFMAHNIDVCLKSCSNYWSHPLFIAHKDYQRYRSSALRYSKTGSPTDKLRASVRREISAILTNSLHRFWRDEIPVFAGGHASQLVEATTLIGAKELRRLFVISHPQAQVFSSIYSGYMRLPKHLSLSSENALDLVRSRIAQLAEVYRRNNDVLLSDVFRKASKLQGLRVYNDDVRAVVRYARLLSPSLRSQTVSGVKPIIGKFPDLATHCRRCVPEPLSVEKLMWERYRRRPRGGESTAGYTWLRLIPTMTVYASTLIVGNGNGGLADLLMTCFKTDVVGLDLEKDMPVENATLLNYIPAGIQLQNRSRFIQSDWSINSTGDWTDYKVREKVLSQLMVTSSVFIDITEDVESGDFTEGLIQTCTHPQVGVVYARLMGTNNTVWTIIEQLQTLMDLRVWTVSRSFASIEVIVELKRFGSHTHVCSSREMLILEDLPSELQQLIPERRAELVTCATCSIFEFIDESLPEVYSIIRNVCQSLLNKPKDQQLKYKDRRAIIVGYATIYAAVSPDSAQTIQEWIADDLVVTDLFKFGMDSDVRTHLIRYVARLLSLDDRSALFTQQ